MAEPMFVFTDRPQAGIAVGNPTEPEQGLVHFTAQDTEGRAVTVTLTREQARTFAQHVLETYPDLGPGMPAN